MNNWMIYDIRAVSVEGRWGVDPGKVFVKPRELIINTNVIGKG